MGYERRATAVALLVALSTLAACAAGDERFTGEDPAGFWFGLWHGLIALPALIIGLFADGVQMYERNNTGGWYDLGFLIGIGIMAGGGCRGASGSSGPSEVEKVDVDIDVHITPSSAASGPVR